MGEFMKARALVPDLVLASSARRAQQTAERVCRRAGYEGPVRTLPGLYLAEPGAVLACLRGLGEDPERVMCVGHNPGLEEFASTLAGRHERLPTAALAVFELDIPAWNEAFQPGSVRRFEVFRVKELPS